MEKYPEFYKKIIEHVKALRAEGKLRFLRDSELSDLAQEAVCYYAVHGSIEKAVAKAAEQFKPPIITTENGRERQYEIPVSDPQAFLYQDLHDPHERFEVPRKQSLPFANHFDRLDKLIKNKLSDWEHDIYLCYFRSGMTQKETAEELGTTQQNVSYHLKRIRQKLDV